MNVMFSNMEKQTAVVVNVLLTTKMLLIESNFMLMNLVKG